MLSAAWIWITAALFAYVHSVLASQRCKAYAYRLGLHEPRYRLIYSLLAIVTTAIWIGFVHQLPDVALYQTAGGIQGVLITIQMMGGAVLLAALHPIDGLAFLGFRASAQGDDPFIVKGIYRWLRHPMYSGAMLILLAMPQQTWNGLHLALAICAYFIIGARFEEQRMLAVHPEYADYRKTVPAFIPHLNQPTQQ